MIKVMVVVWGLVMFVPEGVTTGGIPKAEDMKILFAAPRSGLAMEHDPSLWIVNHGGTVEEYDLGDGEPAFEISQRSDEHEIDLSARWYFPRLDVLKPGAAVRPDCLANNYLCGSGSTDWVIGTAEMSGTWSTGEATVCKGRLPLPVRFDDPALFSYRTAHGKRREVPPFKLATAMTLTAEVLRREGETDVLKDVLKVGGKGISLPILESEACRKWMDEDGPCAVFVLGNPPAEPARQGHRTMTEDDALHLHFAFFYELTEGVQVGDRWLPFVEANPDCPAYEQFVELYEELPARAVITPPAVRCPPTFASEPE